MSITPEQHAQLIKPINPKRVAHSQGQSHLESYEVSAHLTRIFGFTNWEKQIRSLACIREDAIPDPKKGNRIGWFVTYRCEMRLIVKDPAGKVIWANDDVACGDSQNQPSHGDAHDMASKTAVSQALKRCAKDLGDQMGLSLYRGGSTAPLVGRTLVVPTRRGPRPATPVEDVEEHAPEHEPEQSDVPSADPTTGEVAEPADWSEAEEEQRHQEAAEIEMPDGSSIGPVSVADVELPEPRPHEDLGGQLPPATPRERIAEAREHIEAHVPLMHAGDNRSIHNNAKLLGHVGQAGHEWVRATGNAHLGLPPDTSVTTWTLEQGKAVLKHTNEMVKESRRAAR